jgi:3-hydroxyacyl-CoA dehydrogenase
MSVSSVAVVGAGPTGLSIAEAVAQAELPVTVYCVTAASSAHAKRRLERTLSLRERIGQLDHKAVRAILARVRFTRDLSATCEADLVIESAVGDVRARRAILATLETRMSRGSVLASNATRGQLASMSEALMRPDQFIGLRFFHPATTTQLVEVMPLPDTAPGALFACYAFCRWIEKTPVEQVVGDVETPRLRMPKIAAAR